MAPCSGFLTWEIPRTEDWWATVPGGTKESENNVATKQQPVCLGEDVKGMYRSQREAPPQPQVKEQATRAGLGGFPGTRGFKIIQGHQPREHRPSQSGL